MIWVMLIYCIGVARLWNSAKRLDFIINYLDQFPITPVQLLPRLRGLLASVSDNPQIQVKVTTRYDFDQYGPNLEYVHMIV